MRRFLATASNCATALAATLLSICSLSSPAPVAASDLTKPDAAATAAPTMCGSHGIVVYEPDPSSSSELDCAAAPRTAPEIADARAYLTETASPGYTMALQGMELAIGRLHPEFVVRLANAIREARNAGLRLAGVFSAYRPPAFGIGGFRDKFHSLHTYGLAVDLRGIGTPASTEAQLWHEIAARNGVVCPYGPRDRAEWNHCQPTSLKIILADNPLRETVTAAGPLDLDTMFEAGNAVIASMESAADSLVRAEPTPPQIVETPTRVVEPGTQSTRKPRTHRDVRAASSRIAAKPVRQVGAKLGARTAASRVAAKPARQVVAKLGTRAAVGRVAAKPARQVVARLGARAGPARTPIIAVEERRRGSKAGSG
jgi:hypothetical protein